MNTRIIKLDINKKLYETITAKQGDTGSRFLLFHIFDSSLPFDLTGKSVRVYGIKPDDKKIFNDLVINDAKKGYCTLELTNQILSVAGLVKLELVIYNGNKKLSSIPFVLNVISSLNSEDAVVSTNEFTVLMNGLAALSEYDTYKSNAKQVPVIKEEVSNLSAQLEHKANEVDLDVERKRIDSFTRLQEGSTTGDAELIDGRISDDGIVRANLGENIRTNLSYIKSNIEGNVDLYYEGVKNIVLMLKNGKLNATTGAEETDSVAGITNLIQFSHNEEFTCSVQSAYFDIFVYDDNGSFEKKIGYQSNDNVKITFAENKLYRFQITPSNWTTVINNYNYTNYIINAKLKIDSKIVDIKVDKLKEQIIAGKEKLTFEWKYGKFNTDTGEFEDATDYIRTDKLTFRDNETITFGCIVDTNYYYFIEEYDTVNNTNKCIFNTKKTGSFVVKPNCQYVFAVWYGGTDFSDFYSLYDIECTLTLEPVKQLQVEVEQLQVEVEQLQVGNVKDNVHLDFPDNLYIKKGDTLEIFKYGTYYTDKPYLENEYNIRIVNIGQYTNDYSHKIVINCPSDYTGDTLRNSWDLPMIQLMNKYGEIVESKRFTIHVVGTPTKALNVCYFGDSWTAMAYRTQKTAELISGTNIKLLGKFYGNGVGNKFTGSGGYAWDNYVDDPATLPSDFPNNYLWDSATNDISFTKFMANNCGGENIDVAVVLLGWNDKENGAFANGFSMDKIKTKCKYFIEKLHSQYPNCKVILESYTYGYPFYRSSYSSTMPQVLHNKYIYELNNLYKTIADTYSYVEFLPLSCYADVFYNMPMAEMNANKYNSEKIKYCKDDAHLSPEGFYQCAEAETNILMYYAK